MKLTDTVRSIYYQRLTNILHERCVEVELREVLLYLNIWNDINKIIPYGLFDNTIDDLYEGINETREDVLTREIFTLWLINHTHSIEKPFNKSRKVARRIKELVNNRIGGVDTLLDMEEDFVKLISAFCVSIDTTSPKFTTISGYSLPNPMRAARVLSELRTYLSLILYLEMLTTEEEHVAVLRAFINPSKQGVYEDLKVLRDNFLRTKESD